MGNILRFLGIIFALNLILLGMSLVIGQIHPARGTIAYTYVDQFHDPRVHYLDVLTGIQLEVSSFIEGDGLGRHPRWSQTGESLAFWLYPNRGDIFAYEMRFPIGDNVNLSQQWAYNSLPIYGNGNLRGFGSFSRGAGRFYIVNESYPQGREILDLVQSPQFSPDGRYLAYLAVYEVSEGNEAISTGNLIEIDLYTYELATDNIRNWTESIDTIGVPQWSPDSSKIVFSSRERNFGTIYLLDLLTGNLEELPINSNANSVPQWSPDARYLSFVSNQSGNFEISLLELESLELRNLSAHPSYDIQPTWSPDGERLVFVSRRNGQDDLYLYDLATGQLSRLTNTLGNEADPAWRPR